MRPRVAAGRFLIRLGGFIQSLAIRVMKPADLIEFSRRFYGRGDIVDLWARSDLVDAGLARDEEALLQKLPVRAGRLLLLGVGGGREAIPLARAGFQVTGADFVPAMVQKAQENASARGVRIEGLVQDIARLDMPPESYDVVWLSSSMYSCVPTRARRVQMGRRILRALTPGGYFICQFRLGAISRPSPKVEMMRRAFAVCTLGNTEYEQGDELWAEHEFIHMFPSADVPRSELEECGFQVVYTHVDQDYARGGAVSRKGDGGTTITASKGEA